MSSSTSRSDGANTNDGVGGAPSVSTHHDLNPTEPKLEVTASEEGECSDSDALLPPLRRSLSPDPSLSSHNSNSSTRGSSSRGKRIAGASELAEMGLYGEACSPLLTSASTQSVHTCIPSLTHALSLTDDGSASSLPEHHIHNNTARPLSGYHSDASSQCFKIQDNPPRRASWDGFSTTSERSLRRRSPPPRTPQQSSPINSSRSLEDTTIFHSNSPTSGINVLTRQQPYASQSLTTLPFTSSAHDEVQGFLPASILSNPPFVAPGETRSVSSAPSSSNSSREVIALGVRRFVRSRVTARTRTTAGSSSSQRSTQSLGDEDLFALTLNGEDPRLPISNTPPPLPQQPNPSQRALWDAARMHSSEQFPPIVWEESSDAGELPDRRRRRTFSEPSGNRLRGFLFPTPGVRRRGVSRQSRSVRRHLPRSSSTSSANMLAASPLSTTAAAVLFTSSQASQASIDSFQEYALSPQRLGRSRQPSRQRPGSSNQLRMSSHILDDSARAGVGTTSHRSIVMDGAGADALSISTIGNSTMARSDPAGLGESGRQSQQGNPAGTTRSHVRETNAEDGADEGEGNVANSTDPNREARVRWVRINQRFQLMITFVAICFSLLLFSILISWIVLTSAYVVTFEKECDIPLKLFYWLVTIQLVLDVFRNDIMRYVLRWDPAAQQTGNAHQFIPARVVAYNIAYLAYALLVLRMGVNCVYIVGRQPEYMCRSTAPALFQSSVVFVTLTLAAWATIILGYLVPFCFVATLLTLNGYNPGEAEDGAVIGSSPIPGGVFPTAYSNNGAPPGTIEQLRELDLGECGEQECCICMEDFRTGRHNGDDAIIQTDCGHILHKNCCSVWLRQARTCPVCRTDIPNAQAERMRQEQVELGQDDSNQTLQQPPGEEHHPPSPLRAPVAPHLPFRPAGRQEVATLIRALRQPRRERGRSGRRRASGSNTSDRSPRRSSAGSNGMEGSRNSRNEESQSSANIEMSRRGDATASSVHTQEGNRSNGPPTNGGNSGEVQYV